MKVDNIRVLLFDLRSMLLALAIGLIFALINSVVTILLLSIWTDLIFQGACNISLLYDYGFGKVPYVHLFIAGFPLFVLAGIITTIVTSKSIKSLNDAVIMGSTTGMIASIVPYGSTWALLLLFADYWADLLPHMQYFILVLLGVALLVPITAFGSYYYFKHQLRNRSMASVGIPSGEFAPNPGMMRLLKIPLLLLAITILTIILPLAIAYIGIQVGLISGSPL